jgi:hypothetical protein
MAIGLGRMPSSAAALVTMATLSSAAWGQDGCQRYVGQSVSPVSFNNAIAPFAKLTPKTEFENTSDYQARVAKTVGVSAGSPIVIAKAIENRAFVEYNADRQSLGIYLGAFGDGLDAWSSFISTPYWNELKPNVGSNVAVVVSDPDVLIGSAPGSNAFGVRVTIKNYRRITHGIFDHAGGEGENTLFPPRATTTDNINIVGEIAMSPAQAKVVEPAISLALVVVPKTPYLITGSRYAASPTLDSPKRVKEEYSILIADIQCALALDGNHKILAAFPTN